MAEVDATVNRILATDCGHSLEELARQATDDDLARLVEIVASEDEASAQVERAIFILGRMRRREALEPILDAVHRLDEQCRIAAADALGRLGGAKARNELVELSSDGSPYVRKFAAHGLSRIGDTRSLDRLRQLAAEDDAEMVKRIARKTLDAADDT